MFLMNYKMGNDLKIENIYFEFKKNFQMRQKSQMVWSIRY